MVAFSVGPVAQIVIAKRFAEQVHHALLGLLFDLADGAHISLVFPVRSSCIIPCLRARLLSRLCSRTASSASASLNASAMASCSPLGGSGIRNRRRSPREM